MAAWVLTAFVAAFVAAPVSANTCSPATTRGTAPADYQDYCWLDFSGYSDSVARSTGQKFSYALPDGSTLSLTLQVSSTTTGTAIVPTAVPSWSGAAFGNSGFIGIPGKPVLYEGTNGSTVQVTLSNIAIAPPAGSSATSVYAIVAADGESTNGGETLSFTTNGTAWTELAAISNGSVFPTLGGVGTGTVTETGAGGTVGAYAFSSLGNPTTIGSTLVGSGLQGAIFALRYASISLTAQLSGARATASDQFTYGLATTGGSVLASATSTGTGTGPFPAASLPLLAATYPFVVSETMASGSASTLANYGVSLTCTNASTGSSTSLPTNLAANTYTFPALNYGDAVSCVFTDTANRANLGVTKTGPATVAGGGALSYTLAVSNQGPSDASGSVIKDPAVANFTAAAVTCGAASGGAVCPANAVTTVANLQGAGITIPTLPSGGALSLTLSGTAGAANITNTASIAPPATVVNSNTTPTSTVTTTVTAAADLATTLVFPASINAGQTVTGTVSYTNNGPSVAAGVTYNLTLPANLAAAPVLTGLPTGAAYTYAAGTGIVTLTGMPATLASGASAGPISVSYVQPPAGTSVVTASDATTTTDPNLANNTASATIGGNPEADLLVALSFPTSVNAGLAVTGTVTYTNNGPSTATGPVFSLTLPANLAAAPVLTGLPTGAAYTYAAGTGIVTLTGMPATLASGATVGPITVSYAQPGTATSTVTAGITATTADPNAANNTASATIGGIAEADLATTLNFPASVNAGGTVTGTVLYTNNGPSAASAVSYTLTLPANLSTAPTLSNLPTGASYTYTAGTGVVSFTGMPATLASAASAGPITVSYVQPGTATSTVTAGITATTADPNSGNNTATATIGGTAEADLAITMSFPASVNAGATVTGSVQFTNNGPSTASGVAYTLTLPANLAASPVLSGLPTGATYSYSASTGVVTFTGLPTTVAAGTTGSITVSYKQPATGSSTVLASALATTNDPNPTNNSGTATIGGTLEADLATTLSFPATVNAGAAVTGTVVYTNNGPSTASGINYGLTLPASLGVAPTLTNLPTGATYTYTAGTGVVTFTGMPATLASAATAGPITVSYVQPGSATSTVTAGLSATTDDPNPANNTASATIGGTAEADLAASLNFPATVNAGAAVTGTVLYTNNGPSTASGITYALTLPPNLATAPTLTNLPTGASYTYTAGTGVVSFSGMPATLASGATVGPITVSYAQPGAATSTVTAGITATTADPNAANNTASATISGIAEADLATTLNFPASVNAGGAVTGTVLYTNNGPSAASLVSYTLTLPANLSTAPTLSNLPTGAAYTYAASTGVITFTGMPATLASAASAGPITVSYVQPGTATSTVTAGITATTADPNAANNTASATIGGVAEADLATTLNFPATVNAGLAVTGTVLYTNNGPSTASGINYTLTLPANLSAAPTLSGLPTGAAYTYAAGTGVITLTGMPATLASAASAGPITVSYVQPGAATSTVTAGITAATADPNSTNNTSIATIGGVAEADLATTLNCPSTVNAGLTVTGTVLYTNNGPSTASGVGYTLMLPANLAAAPTLSGLPTGATYSYTANTGGVTFAGMPATLASAATAGPISVSFTQPGTATSTVTAAISATTNDPNAANNSASATVGGAAEADLATTLSFPSTVNAGATVTGTVTYTNNGPSTANVLTYTLTLPANLGVAPTLSGLPTGVTYSYAANTGAVTFAGMPATLAPGTNSNAITVTYKQPGTGTSSVSASVTATTNDPNPANNTASATIGGAAEADLATTLNVPATINAGATVSGSVLYTNNGPSTASGITYTLTLPANLAIAPTLSGLPTGASYSYAPATGIVSLLAMPATLAASATVGPFSLSYVQPGTATSTVSAAISATTADPNPANNTASATIAGTAEADLATTLSFPGAVNAGLVVSGSLLYTNNGPSTASGLTYTLTLPANLAAAPTLSGLPTGATYSYATNTGVVTLVGMPATLVTGASPGAITISYTQPGVATSTVTAGITATTADPNAGNNSATATIGGTAEADLATTLNFPGAVNAGLNVTGTVLYTNNGPSTASGITYALTLPANLSAAPTLSNLPPGATYSYTSGTGVVTFTGMPATLASAATAGPITVSYVQPGSATSTVTAAITATTADPNAANNSASATIGGTAEADLATTLNFPGAVNAGLNVTGTVLYTNNGPSTASGITYALTLPANLSAAPTLSNLPPGATYSYTSGTGVVTFTGMPATLASAATAGPITVSYVQPGSATSTVTAAITATTADPNVGNNSATATIGGTAEADLAASLSFPATVNAGAAVTGTVLFTNNGPSTASGIIYALTLPPNLATAPTLTNLPTGASYTYTAGTGVVSFSGMPATLASGATVGPITVSYAQPGAATSTVTAGITATTADPNAANNTASATISGIAEADLATTLNFPASVNAGGTVTGTVLYTNNGPSTASGITYALTLPANLSAAPTLSGLPTGVAYTYTAGTGVVSFTGMPATLASAASAGPITVSYVQPGTATSTVTAGATATTADPNAANNTASATIGGTAEADLATTLHFPSTVNAGLPVSGTIQFSNNGPSVATGVSYSVTLSANLATPPTLAGLPTGATYSYNASSGVVTFAGMPTTLAAAATLSPITVAYTQPSTGNSVVTAGVAATTADPNAANNNSSATIAGSALADVTATLSFPANVNAGQAVTGTVMFTNNGPSTAAAVTFLLTLPSNLGLPPQPSFPSGVSYVYTPSTGVVTLNGMPTTLASGASFGPITISYIQPGSAASAVNASIASTTMDPNPNNNAASATVTGAAEADLTTLLHFPANANAGASVAGTVTYTNIGPSTASGVAATLTLPANLTTPPTLTGLPTGAAYTYVASTGIVTLTGLAPTLAAGTSIGPITVLYLQPGSGDSTVSAAATATTNDPQPGNNAVTATITGIPLADLSATLSMAAHANAGQPVAGTLLFANHGPSAAAGVTYTLSLPTNLDVPPAITGLPTGAQANYVAATGVVSFTGMPAALAANTAIGPIEISYAQSASGTSTVSAAIAATTQDPITANNTASTTITGSAAELRGTVYLDNNQDGVFDAGDTPVAGATVTLLAGARVVATVSTDATGYYSFTAQPAGSYNVAVTLASGYLAATPASVAAALTGNAAVTVNFGEIPTAAVGALVLTKTTPLVNISAGQSVPYTITATNPKNTPLDTVTVTDVMPAGFSYRAGSGAINGKKQDPTVAGHTLSWTRIRVPAGGTMTFTLVLTAGAGVGSGEYVNQAMAYNGLTNTLIANIASATVRISGDPTFDCPDLIGKVFDDTNANGREDPGEKGIAGVRLVTAQGLLITTDAEGRYHIACPITPDAEIGTNFIVKLDERTLPSGYRLTTDNPETVRLTTGKVSKLNFGATIHHVIRIEIDAGAFAADGSLSAEVTQRIAAVVAQLGTQAGIVRLVYVASDESDAIAEQRLKTARKSIEALASASKGKDLLRVEEEIVRSTRPRGDAREAQP